MASKRFGDVLDASKWGVSANLISNTDYVGVEVEVEGLRYDDVSRSNSRLSLWECVEDGSLRNGCEFIFKEPTKGRLITSALDNLDRYFSQDVSGVHASTRCGVHVHLDIKDLEPDELINLIMVYMLVERLLFNWVNPERIKNNYCRALTDSNFKATMNSIRQLSTTEDAVHSIISYVNESCEKYAGLNLRPIASFGSIEFRMHQGTTEISRLYKWINIILALKRTARDYKIEYLLEIFKDEGANALLRIIFLGTDLVNPRLNNVGAEVSSILLYKGVKDVEETLLYDTLSKTSKLLAARKVKAVVGNRLIDRFANKLTSNK